jgi:hypothetical protein
MGTVRKPTEIEEKLVQEMVLMVTLVATLHYFIYHLIDEMEEAGKYRQRNKYNINRCRDIIANAHMVFYNRIYNHDFKGCEAYNGAMDYLYNAINECVMLDAPERAYNIIVAIVRLQEKQMTLLAKDNFFYFPPSQELSKIPGLLSGLGIEDHHLDDMLERNVRPIIMERRYAEQ